LVPVASAALATSVVASVARSTLEKSSAAKFRKTIKNHSVAYPLFNEDHLWVTWSTNICIKLRIHGVQLVLDHDYVPQTDEEVETFLEMQNFVFGIFSDTLLTSHARGILHIDDLDAQAVTWLHHMARVLMRKLWLCLLRQS
jgi:uncharacterized protein YhhL (DUF1145 family)